MKVLVVGSGGREHALAWKIASSPLVDEVLAAPGSDGMAGVASCFPDLEVSDLDGLQALVQAESVDLVVVGPEAPLAAGLADRLRERGVAVFGPSALASRLESSKVWAKRFMARHAIPTADFEVFEDLSTALAYVHGRGGPCVVKADGLAAGKGVFVCSGPAEAEEALKEIMEDLRFGEAGAQVVIEDCLVGEEASYYAITDGTQVATLSAAQDFKRVDDDDRGENTGGMGAYCPAPVVTPAVEKRILEEIVHPVVRGMAQEGHAYSGVLYVGLMIDPAGTPRVIEFNVRFGDPETQPLMLALDGDLVPLLIGAAHQKLEGSLSMGCNGAAVCVVLASGGYPRAFEKGFAIEGLDVTGNLPGSQDLVVFHAGSRREESGFVTAGGRVLGITARAPTIEDARARAYLGVDRVSFQNAHVRRDIAARVSTS